MERPDGTSGHRRWSTSRVYDKVAFSTFGGLMTVGIFVLLVGVLLALFNCYVSQEL